MAKRKVPGWKADEQPNRYMKRKFFREKADRLTRREAFGQWRTR